MHTFKRIAGVLLVIAAVASLVVGSVVAVGVWGLRKPASEAALSGLQLASATLQTTGEALVVVEGVLDNAGGSVAAAQDTFQTLSQTIAASGPTLDLVAGFLGGGLPDALRSTQRTVASAAESAKIVDVVLETLAAIPFANLSFVPQTPLSETLGNVAGSLGAVPDGLETLSASLSSTGGTLPELARSLEEFGASMSDVDDSLASAQQIVSSYQDLIDQSQAMISQLQRLIPVLTGLLPAAVTFIVVWLALVQVAAMITGWRWARGQRPFDIPTTALLEPAQ